MTLEDSLGGRRAATSPLAILGPGDVSAIDPAQIVRREPVPGTADADWSLLPAVELAAPDLPWLLTPAAPDGRGALRPWLVLVCVEERSGVEYEPQRPLGAGPAGGGRRGARRAARPRRLVGLGPRPVDGAGRRGRRVGRRGRRRGRRAAPRPPAARRGTALPGRPGPRLRRRGRGTGTSRPSSRRRGTWTPPPPGRAAGLRHLDLHHGRWTS